MNFLFWYWNILIYVDFFFKNTVEADEGSEYVPSDIEETEEQAVIEEPNDDELEDIPIDFGKCHI